MPLKLHPSLKCSHDFVLGSPLSLWTLSEREFTNSQDSLLVWMWIPNPCLLPCSMLCALAPHGQPASGSPSSPGTTNSLQEAATLTSSASFLVPSILAFLDYWLSLFWAAAQPSSLLPVNSLTFLFSGSVPLILQILMWISLPPGSREVSGQGELPLPSTPPPLEHVFHCVARACLFSLYPPLN